MRKITREDWRNGLRNAVLAAMDEYVQERLGHPRALGATDNDLPSLFPCIDEHADRLAARINDPNGGVLGSYAVNIEA